MTLFSMIKIWSEAFWKPAPQTGFTSVEPAPLSAWMLGPVLVLALVTVMLGLFMEPVLRMALAAGEQLLDPRAYILAVQGGG